MGAVPARLDQLPAISVNGRSYGPGPAPVVVVCVDGSQPDYHEQAIEAGLMPFLASVIKSSGTSLSAQCVMPSFTNPNNISIATGVPPAVHGICGNYFLDPDTGQEVMMNEARFLRAPTIFASYAAAGASVALITAKDKLRALLGAGLDHGICFSAEMAHAATVAQNGIGGVLELIGMPQASVYSAELSEIALAAAVKVLELYHPDLMYVSLTDYVQHKYAPGSAPANCFYAMLDRYYRKLDALGVTLVITADHGMNAKSDAEGAPKVIYLQDVLDELCGRGQTRVILPITDPYTAHHGSLGSYATVYLGETAPKAAMIIEQLSGLDEVAAVITAAQACDRFELPRDRIGDLVLLTQKNATVGTTPSRHDLTELDEPLRSHGGLTEQRVPFIVNRPIVGLPDDHQLRNFDAYWVAANFVTSGIRKETLVIGKN
jgi:phosphonoacetate hydrolase